MTVQLRLWGGCCIAPAVDGVPVDPEGPELFTVGYEGQELGLFLSTLKLRGIRRIVDVRELPLSRRKGFSKTPLREALADAGIEYVHLRAAGNPHRALKMDPVRCLAAYSKHLAAHPEVVTLVDQALAGARSALLCFEADHRTCHRSVIAGALVAARHRSVVNL